MSDSLTFAYPGWLYLILLIVPLIAVKVVAANASREGVQKLTSARLRSHLVTARRPFGDWGRFAIQLIGFTLLIVALARPQKGFIEEVTRVEGRNLIIGIDTSRSMLAEDIPPNRLGQAKLAATDLIRELPEDRIGLIAFAGSAFMQAPLTPDHDAVIETIGQLNTFVIQRGGTNIAAAINLARERFAKTEAARNALILFTDGDDLEGTALEAANRAKKDDILIVTVGVGKPVGSIVPDPESRLPGTFLKDASGELVRSRMDAESLEKIAKATNGIFVNLQGGIMNNQLVRNVLANISYSQSEDKLKRTPREHYAIPLTAALGCIVLAFIATLWGSRPAARRAIASILMLGAFLTSNAGASPDSMAYEAFERGNFKVAQERYDTAAELAESRLQREQLSFGLGAAAYQNGEYDDAIDAFGKALVSDDASLQERSHYNLGNTLFRKGEKLWKDESSDGAQKLDQVIRDWEDAAGHYRSSLEINQQNEEAQANLEIVDELLERLKEFKEEQQRQEEEQKKQQEEQKKKEEEEKKDDESSADKKEDDPEGDGGEKQEPGEPDKGAKGDQKQEGDGSEPTEEESDPSDKPQEGEGDGSNNSKPSEEQNPTDPAQDQTQTEPGSEGEQQDEQVGESDEEEEIDEDTGYSKNKARQLLRSLADEQEDLGLLRRRPRRLRTRYKDW